MVECLFTNQVLAGFNSVAATQTFHSIDIVPVLSKEFLDIQATIECRFTLKHVHDMIITYSYTQATYSIVQIQKSVKS